MGWGERIKRENVAAGFLVSSNRKMGVKIPISHLIPLCVLEVSLCMIWCAGGPNIRLYFGGSDYDDNKESRVIQQNKSLTEPEWAFSTENFHREDLPSVAVRTVDFCSKELILGQCATPPKSETIEIPWFGNLHSIVGPKNSGAPFSNNELC